MLLKYVSARPEQEETFRSTNYWTICYRQNCVIIFYAFSFLLGCELDRLERKFVLDIKKFLCRKTRMIDLRKPEACQTIRLNFHIMNLRVRLFNKFWLIFPYALWIATRCLIAFWFLPLLGFLVLRSMFNWIDCENASPRFISFHWVYARDWLLT